MFRSTDDDNLRVLLGKRVGDGTNEGFLVTGAGKRGMNGGVFRAHDALVERREGAVSAWIPQEIAIG